MWTAAFNGRNSVVRLLLARRSSIDLANNRKMTPLWMSAQQNKPECIAILAAAKAAIEGSMHASPLCAAARNGADDCVKLLAYLGASIFDRDGDPFWRFFPDNTIRLRDPTLWERIANEGGDEGTEDSLRVRVQMLAEAGVEDPRDAEGWAGQ